MGRCLSRHLGRHLGRWLLPATCLGLACSSPTLAACGDAMPAHTRLEAQTGGLRLLAAPRPWPVPVGQHVALDILLCAAPGSPLPQGLQVDAEMPAHRHGMNYRATVRPLGGGRFVAEGLLFHMPGRWRLLFDVGDARQPLRLATDLTIE